MKDKKSLLILFLFCAITVLIFYIFVTRERTKDNAKTKSNIVQQKTKPVENIIKNFSRAKITSEIAQEGSKATVFIVTRSKIGIELGSGSGFIVSSDGKIVTNFHVIENAYYASIKLNNGDVYDDISIIDYDERRDLAVLKIKGLKLSTVAIGKSDTLKVGEKVIAIGNPQGLENTVSEGILSSVRNIEGVNVLQITAPISPGSSGGPLFDSKGCVIGITSAMLRGGQNLNFAIPIDYVTPLIAKSSETELSKFQDEFVKKRWIGGEFDITKKSPFVGEKEERDLGYFGILWIPTEDHKKLKVLSLRTYSPAKDAGMKIGDEVLEVKGVKIEDEERFRKMVQELKPNEVVPVKLLRKGAETVLDVKVGKRPKPTNVIEAVDFVLFAGEPVKLAILMEELNFVGRADSQQLQDWKKSQRAEIINSFQNIFSATRNNKNFAIIDTGKIDVILNDLENQYGPLPPQVRDNVLQSLGVTHLISITFSRFAEDRYSAWGVAQRKFVDKLIAKLIDLNTGELLCSDTFVSESNWDGKWTKSNELIDQEDQEFLEGNKLIDKEFKSRENKSKN